MAYDKNMWWNLQGATPPEPALLAPPQRGELGGACNNPMCTVIGADWFNCASTSYYCDACARHINEQCLMLGIRKVCVLQF